MQYDQTYFADKTAVVTGAASGIGLTLAENLLKSGAVKVVMSDINSAKLDTQQKRLAMMYPGKVAATVCDVIQQRQVQHLIAQAVELCGGRLDILFNNAGALFMGWFKDVTDEDWEKAFKLNFYGALYGMRAALPMMQKQGGGQIINIISGTAFTPMPEWSPYAATKAALNALTMAVRYEYWDDHIKISAATPGTTATNIFGAFGTPATAQTPQQSVERILAGVVANNRVTFGDDADAEGTVGYIPQAQEGTDEYLLRVARERRAGMNAI